MSFSFVPLELPGLTLVKPDRYSDERGYFQENYKRSEFKAAGIDEDFAQDNVSRSRRDVLRGLHFQKSPEDQAKLVCALYGEVFDVAVDLRQGSPTYGRWRGVELSRENGHLLFVPAGFAHGFLVLSEEALVSYKTSREYSPAHDAGVRWDDPEIGVEWPIREPLLSPRDRVLPTLARLRGEE